MNKATRLGLVTVFMLLCLLVIPVAVRAQGTILTISQIDKSKFPEITVYVSVTDGYGNPVTGLIQQNFQLEEQGKKLGFVFIGPEEQLTGITTVLIIDRSGSMKAESKIEGAKLAARSFVGLMSANDKAAVVVFDDQVQIVEHLTSNKSLLTSRIDKIVAGGDTALYDAAVKGAEILETTQGRKAAILLTDGLDNSSWHSRTDAIQKAKECGFSLFTIGLGRTDIDRGTLEELAKETGGRMFLAPSAAELTGVYKLISEQIMKEYRLVYQSPRPVEDGTRRPVKVTLSFQSFTQEDEKHYVVAGVLPPSGLGTWTASSWILFGFLLVLMSVLLIPKGVPALIARRRQPYLPSAPPVGVPARKLAPITAFLSAALPLTKPDILLGSGANNDIVIKDRSVADRHTRILQEAGRDVVEDLGSSEGTFVSYSGEPSQERRIFTKNALKEGAYVRLGKTTPIIFHAKPRALVVKYPLRSDKTNTIGSDVSNDIVLRDPSASRKHAQIVWEAETFVVRDLSSEQGTFVRYAGESSPERRITGRNAIKHGSVIRIGDTLLVVEVESVRRTR